jgi:hypothetical protein
MKDESSFWLVPQAVRLPDFAVPFEKRLMKQSGNRMSSMNFR